MQRLTTWEMYWVLVCAQVVLSVPLSAVLAWMNGGNVLGAALTTVLIAPFFAGAALLVWVRTREG